MIEIYRKDLNISGVVISTDIHEVAFGQWGQDEQQHYFIDNKYATKIQDKYYLIENEKTKVYKLLDQGEQPKQNDDVQEQFLIIKLQDEKTSSSYFGVLLDKQYREQFRKPLPFSTFLIEQFFEQIKNWNEKKDTFITFENQGDSFNVQYLEPNFLLQKKITPLEINIRLAKQEVSLNEKIEIIFRKINQLNQNNDKIQEDQSLQGNQLQQYLETDNKLKQAYQKINNLEAKIQQFEQLFYELKELNQQLLQQVKQSNDTKKSWDSHVSDVIQQNNQNVNKLFKKLNKKQKPPGVETQKIKPILQKIDENIYQSNQYKLEENKPLEFNVVLKDLDQEFRLVFTDYQPGESYYEVINEDFSYRFEYPSGLFKKGDYETSAYVHPFGYQDKLKFVLLDDGVRYTLKYSINGMEKPVIKLHQILGQFRIAVKFDNDNIPIDNYVEFTE